MQHDHRPCARCICSHLWPVMLSHISVLLLPHPISVQAAGRAILQQAGGGGKKRRKQPKRAAAPSESLKG